MVRNLSGADGNGQECLWIGQDPLGAEMFQMGLVKRSCGVDLNGVVESGCEVRNSFRSSWGCFIVRKAEDVI